MAAGDHAHLIEDCMRLGDASRGGDPHLWSEVLEYFARQPQDCTEQVLTLTNTQQSFGKTRLVLHVSSSSRTGKRCCYYYYYYYCTALSLHVGAPVNQSGMIQSLGPASPFD